MNLRKLLWLLVFINPMIHVCETINTKLPAIYYGNQGWSMSQVEYLSAWIGKRSIVILLFTDWCNGSMTNLFNYQLNNKWNNQSIPVITWELFGCSGSSQPGITKLVQNNTYDIYINQFGDRLKTWLAGSDGIYGNADDRRAYLRLGHEMNGNWYPWSTGSTPQDYIAAWRHIHDIFTNKTLDSTRLQWIWCVNNADVGNYTAENYWVGDSYADWMGIDGYNFGTSQSWSSWTTPNQVFDNMIARLQNLSSTKPICINEYASSSIRTGNISNITEKYDWLQQFCAYMNNKQINMASYFNTDKETDWAIFGGSHGDSMWNNFSVYTSYRNCLQSSDWIIVNSTNPRLISDAEFSGTVTNMTSTTTTTSTTTSTLTTNVTSNQTSSTTITTASTTQANLTTLSTASANATTTTIIDTSSIGVPTTLQYDNIYYKVVQIILSIIMIYSND